eukprot:3652279-Karenia_brevis.AAC.1
MATWVSAQWPIMGSMVPWDGRQTVPRAEMTAVIRALLAIRVFGPGVTQVTIWSDSKVVVQGYNKGNSHTLQSLL